MIVAKPLSLNVRPLRVSSLSFQVSGIFAESFCELGASVLAFDFNDIGLRFRQANVGAPRTDGRVRFDSDGIDAATKTPPQRFALGALRAEVAKAGLNKAIVQRANVFITKHAKTAEIVSVLQAAATVKEARLARLSRRSQQRTDKLLSAYQHTGRDEVDVVTKTTTDITSKHHEEPFVTTTTEVSEKVTTSITAHKLVVSASAVKNSDKAGAVEIQSIENTGYEFRMPFIEEDMRNDREQNSISDQRVAHFLQSHYLDRIPEIYDNELAALDADINQWQAAYLDTILLSPISGTVTGVYKNPGEHVSAGEPVVRVEDNSEVLIVANLICRGPIAVGSVLQIATPLFDSSDTQTALKAVIVSARCQRDNDHWEVVAKCANLDGAGDTILPLGYSFDFDTTDVQVLAAGEI